MRRHLGAILVVVLSSVTTAGFARAQEISPKLKGVVDSMKRYAESHHGLMSRSSQGTSYFKWIQNPPQGYEKAFFQLTELNLGKKFLSLKLVRKTAGGVELTVLTDNDANGDLQEAFKATGRSLADADRTFTSSQNKLKTAVTPEMHKNWAAMLDELKWELKAD
jgi:hypothetical protein